MGLVEPERIWMPTGVPELRERFLRCVRMAADDRDISNPPVHPGSDWWVVGTGLANMDLVQYHNLRLMERNADVYQAEGKYLDEIRKATGLPEVSAAPAIGKLKVGVEGGGTVTIKDGQQFLYPNRLRGKVVGNHLGIADGDLVSVIAIDTGTETNLAAGKKVEWVSPPLNVKPEAEVSTSSPLRDGTDKESDERKRDRIINRRQNVPQGGNSGHVIEIALNALGTVQYAFCYPALGGPSSAKVCIVRDIDPANKDWSRIMLDGGLQIVRNAIHSQLPDSQEIVVCTVVEVNADVALETTIPQATSAGGNGQGWLDNTVWPDIVGADNGRVSVSSVASSSQVTVGANTTVSPIAGQTHVGWWTSYDQEFQVALVTAVSGSAGAWVLTLDRPWVDSSNTAVAAGDLISPAAVHMNDYAQAWRTVMRRLGPAENTTDANRLPRAKRHPFADEQWFSDLGFNQLDIFKKDRPEIINLDWSYRSDTTPGVPASVADNPKILRPRHFAIYEQ